MWGLRALPKGPTAAQILSWPTPGIEPPTLRVGMFLKAAADTFDGGAVGVLGLLQPGHGERGLDAHVGELVGDADEHGLVDPVEEVVVDLRVLRQAPQDLVDELAGPEPHRVAVGVVGLRTETGAESELRLVSHKGAQSGLSALKTPDSHSNYTLCSPGRF